MYLIENKSGSVCGTPNYIAPEVLHKQGHSTASEVNIFTSFKSPQVRIYLLISQ